LVLRWSVVDQTGQDDGIGIDDLSFSAAAVPEPSSIVLAVAAALGALGIWRRKRASMN
jgi:hypothetical protein